MSRPVRSIQQLKFSKGILAVVSLILSPSCTLAQHTILNQQMDLERAINEAQGRSVAIYAFFAPTVLSSTNTMLTATALDSRAAVSL